jgi:hypothetical protein
MSLAFGFQLLVRCFDTVIEYKEEKERSATPLCLIMVPEQRRCLFFLILRIASAFLHEKASSLILRMPSAF